MTDFKTLPLNAAALIGLVALQERLHERINQIARAIEPIRAEGWRYRPIKGSFDAWHGLDENEAYLDRFELDDSDKTNLMVDAVFAWWWGDSREEKTIRFHIGYLDMTDDQFLALERAKVNELKATHDAKTARAAEKAAITRAQTIERAKIAARDKAIAEIPGFEALPRDTRQAIIESMVKA